MVYIPDRHHECRFVHGKIRYIGIKHTQPEYTSHGCWWGSLLYHKYWHCRQALEF